MVPFMCYQTVFCMRKNVYSIILYNSLTAMGIVRGIPFFYHPRIWVVNRCAIITNSICRAHPG
ncbi:hypothetical protein DW690_21000 [Dorea longicatena]|nr:hypothetical protein DW690_21000 [Dorea longicatena]